MRPVQTRPPVRQRNSLVAFALLVVAPICASAGCGKTKRVVVDASAEQPPVGRTSLAATAPFAQWPDPELMIVVSGQQLGMLEPCGCSQPRIGGLARRHGLIDKLESRGWPVIGLDLGGLVRQRRSEQSEFKLATMFRAMQIQGYRAVGIGLQELQFDAGLLLALGGSDQQPPLVSANLRFRGLGDDAPQDHVILQQGNVQIGVTSVYGVGHKAAAESSGNVWSDANDSLADVVPQLRDAELRVLMCYGPLQEARSLAEQFPQFDLVVCTGGGDSPTATPQYAGNTMLIQLGHKGMHVGAVGYFGSDSPRLRYQLIKLDEQWPETAPIKELLESYQLDLREGQVISSLFRSVQHQKDASDAHYIGTESCGECHQRSHDAWSESGHAHAFESLVEVNRQYDPECVSCHVIGWHPQEVLPHPSGFRSLDQTPHLTDVGCENCHGPGSRHVAAEEDEAADRGVWRQALHLEPNTSGDNFCIRCHDLDNSPDFNFDEYWTHVVHPWRD